MGGPITGARPSPARPSEAVLAPAPFLPGDPVCCPWARGASPLLPQHWWPNTLRTDTRCCCLPVPPGPGAEAAAPGPASCAPCSPPQACTSLSPVLTSVSLCILCPVLTSTSLHTPEPCARLPVPVPAPTHSKGSARSQERWGLCRIPRICIPGIGDRPRVCSQPSSAQPCLPPCWGWSRAPPRLCGSNARKRGHAAEAGSPPAPFRHRRSPPPLPRSSQFPTAQEGRGAGCRRGAGVTRRGAGCRDASVCPQQTTCPRMHRTVAGCQGANAELPARLDVSRGARGAAGVPAVLPTLPCPGDRCKGDRGGDTEV